MASLWQKTLFYLGLVDEWMGLSILLTTSEPAAFHLYPVETVSQSEAGFELLYQQSCVTPVFDLALEEGVMRELELTLAFEYEGGFPE